VRAAAPPGGLCLGLGLCVALGWAGQCCAGLCLFAALCCTMLGLCLFFALCCAMLGLCLFFALCCAMLRCAVLCCAVQSSSNLHLATSLFISNAPYLARPFNMPCHACHACCAAALAAASEASGAPPAVWVGACAVDVATGQMLLGQWLDDELRSQVGGREAGGRSGRREW
jgi:hypothetical protein